MDKPISFLIKELLIISWLTTLHKLILGTVILNGTEKEKEWGSSGVDREEILADCRDPSSQCRELVTLAVGVFYIQFPLGHVVVECFYFTCLQWLLIAVLACTLQPSLYLFGSCVNTWLSAGGNDLKVAEI